MDEGLYHESAVARESKPERDSFEMKVNVEKDLAMQKSRKKNILDVGSSPSYGSR